MSFFTLIIKNLIRQPVRASLTLLGIAIGITTVVALGVITSGFRETAGQILRLGGADFIVAQKGTADLTFSTVTQEELATIVARDDIEWASGAMFHVTRVGSNPFFVVMGMEPGDLSRYVPTLVEGELLPLDATDQILLGEQASRSLGAEVGDTVTISNRDFVVTGIYQSNEVWLNGGSLAALSTVQDVTNRPDQVTMVYIRAAEGVDPDELAERIRADYPQLVTVSNASEYGEVDQGIEILDAANIAISALAVGIGAIGVMNTMIMSVFERTREIGVLRAVGWGGLRILRMVISESLLLCIVAAGLGIVGGILLSRLVLRLPSVGNLLTPVYSVDIFIRALAVAVFVALAGAAYPAIRAVRLTPMEALRYE